MSSTTGQHPPLLDGPTQWPMWKLRIKSEFDSRNVAGFAYGKVARYTTMTGAPSASIYPSISSTTGSSIKDTWEARDLTAHSTMILFISDGLIVRLGTSIDGTSEDLMKALIAMFEETNTGALAYAAFRSIMDSRWDGEGNVEDHLTGMRTKTNTLISYGRVLDDELLAFTLLYSLPDLVEYKATIKNITGQVSKGKKLTFADAEAAILTDAIISRSGKLPVAATPLSDSALNATAATSKHCDHHGNNGTHTTAGCYVIHPELRPKPKFGSGKPKAKMSGKAHKAKAKNATVEDSDEESGDEDAMYNHTYVISQKSKNLYHAYLTSEKDSKDALIHDSGASNTFIPHLSWVDPNTFRPLVPPRRVAFGDDSFVEAIGTGTMTLVTKKTEVKLTHVLVVPDFKVALISVSKLAKHGLYSVFDYATSNVISKDTQKKVLRSIRSGGIYRLMAEVKLYPEFAHAAIDINVLHRRWGHLNYQSIQRMVSEGQLLGINKVTGKPMFCEPCELGKHQRLSLKTPRQRASRPFELIHCDIFGPITPMSRSGAKYGMVLVDDFLSHPWAYFMKNKSEAQSKYNQFKDDVKAYYETEVGHFKFSVNFIKFFRSDGAPELAGGPTASKTFIEQLRREGTFKEDSAADTQSQDGVAERMIKTINYSATTMLIDSKLPKNFWAEAVNTATFMLARRPSSSQGGKSPWTKMTGRRVDPSMWRPFCCPAYAHLEKPKRDGKFSGKAVKCSLLGYAPGMKAYRLFNLKTKKIFASRHVTFDEAGHIDTSIFSPRDNLHNPSQSQWEDLLQNNDLEFSSDPNRQISGSLDDSGSISDSSSDDEYYPPTSAPLIPLTGNLESISMVPSRKSEPRNSRIPTRVKVEPTIPAIPPPAKAPSAPTMISAIPSPAKAPSPAPTAQPKATILRSRPTPAVSSRQSMGPPPAPTRPSSPPARFVAGTRRSTRVAIPQRRNAEFIKATDHHAQRLEDRKAKRNAPPMPSTPVPEADSNPVPSGPALDTVIEGLMEGKGDSDNDLNGDIDVTEAMFAFLASTGVSLSPNGIATPETLQEAYAGAQSSQWRKAMMEEIKNLDDNDVYETVPTPDGVKPISTKPVMRIKLDKNGNIERFKLRIVARGFVQKKGVNYEETFAPVANLESIRIICALAAKYDLELDQMDVSTAYLNGVLDEEIYISPPEGVPIEDGFCWKLKKSIYGLKQAGRTWNRTLDAALTKIGFQQLNAETCLYVFRGEKGEVCFLVVYVDDLLLAASTTEFMRTIKTKLLGAFKMRDLGPASFILGLEIIRNRANHTIALSQSQYISKVLERCGMTDCSTDKTPM